MDRRKHLVSCIALVQDRIHYAPLASHPHGKERLLAAMRQAKALYDSWLANPCFPHLLAEVAPRIAPRTNADSPPSGTGTGTGTGGYYPAVTNVGRVENYIAPVWPRDSASGEVLIRVDEMHLACRWWTPCVVIYIYSSVLSVPG